MIGVQQECYSALCRLFLFLLEMEETAKSLLYLEEGTLGNNTCRDTNDNSNYYNLQETTPQKDVLDGLLGIGCRFFEMLHLEVIQIHNQKTSDAMSWDLSLELCLMLHQCYVVYFDHSWFDLV